MESKSKIETFIGFIIRAGKYKAGLNAVNTLKSAQGIIVCNSMSENSFAEVVKLSKRFHCPIYKSVGKLLEEYIYKPNVKIIAVTDKALFKAFSDEVSKENKEFILC